MLGAEEYGFATSALIVLGCVMMRKCHLNTCPTGVATQNEELRKRFMGKYTYLVNFFNFLAEDVREHLAALGFSKLDDVIGRTDLLEYTEHSDNLKMSKLDFSKLLYVPNVNDNFAIRNIKSQKHDIAEVQDRTLIELSMPALSMHTRRAGSNDNACQVMF